MDINPEVRRMKLTELKSAPYNPRQISEAALKGLRHSLKRYGLVQPIVWNQRTGNIVGGHQRVLAMQQEGVSEANVVVIDIPEIEEKALNVTLNNKLIEGEFTAGLGDILGEISQQLPDAFEALKLDDLFKKMSGLFNEAGDVQEDTPPPPPDDPVTKPGDFYRLGAHRLLCGDSTNSLDVNRVLEGGSAAMVWTDPPWNVAIGQDSNPRHRQREGLRNDNLGTDFITFLHSWCAACLPQLEGDLYCVMGCGEWPAIDKALRDVGMHWSSSIVWVKDSFVLGRSQYHRRFEPIWYGWNKKNKSSYVGGRDQDDVWEFKRPKVSEEHPTMKPVGLVAKAVTNSSLPGDVVFDPFLGSGSTLMACEQTGRRCFGIEIEPRFCDVIIQRYMNATGKDAILDGTKTTWREQKAANVQGLPAVREEVRASAESEKALL